MIPSHTPPAKGSRTYTALATTLFNAGLACLLVLLGGCSASSTGPAVSEVSADHADKPNSRSKFLVIAHRGASGYRPEHTMAAYQLAIDQGADFIEPDLVPTKDGVLIARHENALAVVKLLENGQIARDANGKPTVVSATTDVAERPEFAHLLRVGQIDGRAIAGWFSEDFTFAEIQTLYARERIPQLRPNNAAYDRLRIPSLDEILDLVQQPQNSHIGLYPELKHPTHFRFGHRGSRSPADAAHERIAIDTAQLLTTKLAARGFTESARLYIQCFEVETLRRLKHQLLPGEKFTAPLVQLVSRLNFNLPDVQYHRARAATAKDSDAYLRTVYGPLAGPLSADASFGGLVTQLDILASDYASGIGPRKGDAQAMAQQVRALGLDLHPYTVRAEPYFLDEARGALASSVGEELETLKAMGATGVFIDQPDLAVRWRPES